MLGHVQLQGIACFVYISKKKIEHLCKYQWNRKIPVLYSLLKNFNSFLIMSNRDLKCMSCCLNSLHFGECIFIFLFVSSPFLFCFCFCKRFQYSLTREGIMFRSAYSFPLILRRMLVTFSSRIYLNVSLSLRSSHH